MEKKRFWSRLGQDEFSLYGEIVMDAGCKWSDDDVAPADVRDALAAAGGRDIFIRVNSPGGDVFSGIAIYNQLKAYPGRVTAKVEGLAASIASVIVMAADEIQMPENSYLMVHRAWTYACGNAEELMEQAAVLERIDGSMMDAYREKLKNPSLEDELRAAVEAEIWMGAREAARFFNLTVTGAEEIAASAGSAAALARCKAVLPAGMREEDENEPLAEEIRLRLKLMEMEG